MAKKYIIPIEATTLAHYYSRACIAPISYLKKGHHDAIQSIYPNAILLTEHYGVNGSNCYLVVSLTDEEFNSERINKISEDFFLYVGALPISRIDEIVFNTEEQRDTTISNVEMGNAFVRGCVISVGNAFEQVDVPENIECATDKDSQLAEALKEYDRVMGALMFMRLAKDQNSTYSPNFIQTLALYSPFFKQQLNDLSIDTTTKYSSFFDEKYSAFRKAVQNFISEDTVRDFARTQKVAFKIDPIKGYNFQSLSANNFVYTLALLQNFAVADAEGGRDKIDDLILNGFYHRGFIMPGRAESFAFYYGYNRGYDKFRNQYKLDKKCVEVKFRFDTFFEKYIAEEVFQTLVTKTASHDLSFLSAGKLIKSKKIGEDTYKILDVTIVIKKKLEQEVAGQKQDNNPIYANGYKGYSENKELVDIRCAEFLALTLTKKGDRKDFAASLGLAKNKLRKEKEIIDFLLCQVYDDLERQYLVWLKEKEQTPTAKNSKKSQSDGMQLTLLGININTDNA